MPTKEKTKEPTKLYKESLESFLSLHEELIKTKDDLISQLQEENIFLKQLLIGVQEDYDEDRDVIKVLQSQVKMLQNELDFVKRKYKLMWNQAVENYSKN